ncbi:DUF721 domain-containing protein [Chryseobacterium salipaludis]|uniref:DciA family protein n=1 Tax=Chryseobacterium TaxID=59732 RepID=UPI001FF42864|nr:MULTISPECIES: DciA family protein [Chryseobacterium]MCJ8497873.1 DUF721 domain-containing protein [Chryseobacterium salipaludis]MCX3296928.1 DciA family protein [Planobacterium sp. JC490]
MSRKKREFQSSELVRAFAKIHGFEEKLLAFEVKDYLREYLNENLFNDIESVNLRNKVLEIRVKSPLLRHDFQMRKTVYLTRFREEFGEDLFTDLLVL